MINQDLVGQNLKVVDAKNQSLVGLEGEVIDESKNTIVIATESGEKTLLKDQVVVEVKGHIVDGELLTQTPEKRTKLHVKKWQRKKPKNQ